MIFLYHSHTQVCPYTHPRAREKNLQILQETVKYPKICILLLNWNGKKDTLECLASLQRIQEPQFQILVIDNGSTDDSVSAIRHSFPEIPILETGKNLGFAQGNNVGIEWALTKKAEWIFLLNNDTIVASDLLQALLDAADKEPKAKILGAKIYCYYDKQKIDQFGGFWNKELGDVFYPSHGKTDDGISYNEMEQVDCVCGAALFMHRSVPETIGLLDPRFFLFWEETDFCLRAKRAGFEVWTAPQAKVWHKVSASFTGGKPHTHYFWWRSRLLWIERNYTPSERHHLYRRTIFPQIKKELRHYILKSLQLLFTRDTAAKEKILRYRAGLTGVFHYWKKRFGNCPAWLCKKNSIPK